MQLFRRRAPELSPADTAERDRRRQLVADYQDSYGWWHSIDLDYGVVTTGYKTAEHLRDELEAVALPDLHGKTLLDIGAWDGFYSYEAERRGAERVVALDHFVWSLDTPAQHRYLEHCRQEGRTPQPYETVPEIWRPDELPGKRGFDMVHQLLDSKVESVVSDFMTMDLSTIGTFDVVLFLGVLYHLKDPIGALERLRSVTRELAVVETQAFELPRNTDYELWQSFSADQLCGDVTNWWIPNTKALVGMCRAVGFREVTVSRGQKELNPDAIGPQGYRLFVHCRP